LPASSSTRRLNCSQESSRLMKRCGLDDRSMSGGTARKGSSRASGGVSSCFAMAWLRSAIIESGRLNSRPGNPRSHKAPTAMPRQAAPRCGVPIFLTFCRSRATRSDRKVTATVIECELPAKGSQQARGSSLTQDFRGQGPGQGSLAAHGFGVELRHNFARGGE
jgi:hypothetical protein